MDKIAILTNVTTEILAVKLKNRFDVYQPSGFNTWQQEVLDGSAGLFRFKADMVFVILYVDPFMDEWYHADSSTKQIEDWVGSIHLLASRMPQVPIFVSSLDVRGYGCEPAASIEFAASTEAYWIEQIQNLQENIYIFPFKELIANEGRNHIYSDKAWYLSNFPYTVRGLGLLCDLIQDCWFCVKGNGRKKCLVVDLDNTLWGGTAGEDGLDGIILSCYKEGARYYNMQKCLKKIKENGILLAIISKNNLEDVREIFEKHPYMVLDKNDFVAWKINWDQKPENMKMLASELNIGLDAFVFFDDNAAERAQMKMECPEVAVPVFPKDTTQLPFTIRQIYNRYFKALNVTNEDQIKTWQYQQERKRKKVKESASSIGEYLKDLEIEVHIRLIEESDGHRVAQLIGKTNQFNVTSIRYSEKELYDLAQNSNSDIIVGEMKDRFGTEGLTAVMILRYESKTAVIDTFLMSCRVMGRQFESVFMESVKKWLRKKHPELKQLTATYIKSNKNNPVENLYEKLGFDLYEERDGKGVGEKKQYSCSMDKDMPLEEIYKNIYLFKGEYC